MTFYPALEPHNTTSSVHPVAAAFAAHGLPADTPVRVTVRPPAYVPLTGPHSTEFHRAAQAAIEGKRDALCALGRV